MINREVRLFFTALSFYTRLPMPVFMHQDNRHLLADSIRYLPLVGWIAGALAGLVYLVADMLFGHTIGLLFSMVATILLTGAFHEDGFADVCDGFGGGWTKEKILLIMKDSTLGTYGVTGLVLVLSVKFAAMQQLVATLLQPADYTLLLVLWITAHTLSRFAAITLVFTHQYVRVEESKSGGAVDQSRSLNLLVAGILTLLPVAGLIFYTAKPILLLILLPVGLLILFLGRYFKKWIGGYTGDCLGAVQQLSEVLIYLSLILLWKYI